MFASRHTLGDKRGTLGCWDDDLLVEALAKDLDAAEAHLEKRLEVKVLAWIGGKSSGKAGLLKRALQYDAATESFLWCIGKRCVQDADATLQVTERNPRVQDGRHNWHDGHWCDIARRRPEARRERNCRLPERPGISDVYGSGQTWDPDGSFREIAGKYAACGWRWCRWITMGGLKPWCGVGGNMPVSLEVQRTIK